MNTPSLEFLLQTLVNSPEEDRRALTRSAIGLLREVCNTLTKSNYSKFQQTAELARQILDQILLGKIRENHGDGADEEEFLESGDLPVVVTESGNSVAHVAGDKISSENSLPNLRHLANIPQNNPIPDISSLGNITTSITSLPIESTANISASFSGNTPSKVPDTNLSSSVSLLSSPLVPPSVVVPAPVNIVSEPISSHKPLTSNIPNIPTPVFIATPTPLVNIAQDTTSSRMTQDATSKGIQETTSSRMTQDATSKGIQETSKTTSIAYHTPTRTSGPNLQVPAKIEDMSMKSGGITAVTNLFDLVKKWNSKAEPWLQIILPQVDGVDACKTLIQAASAVRSNLLSATTTDELNKEDVKRFEKYWKLWCQEIESMGFEITPNRFGRIEESVGHIIYSCRPNLSQKEIAVLIPGLKKDKEYLLQPVTLTNLPPDIKWPETHQDRNFAPHWRAIFGEIELLLQHLRVQNSVVCAIEGVNKNRIETFVQSKDVVLAEISRRADALRGSLQKDENIYRLATNFWRVLECFWAIFHDDDRPNGYSFFDRIRRRVQSWQTAIRTYNQLYVKNFDSNHDSLASVNKYLGNIILQSKQGVPPGAILRELRPSVIVKIEGVTRLLKGRVIAT